MRIGVNTLAPRQALPKGSRGIGASAAGMSGGLGSRWQLQR